MSDLADWRCRHCDEQIPFTANRCPECGARQGLTDRDRKIIVAIAGIAIPFFLMGLFGVIALQYAISWGEYDPGTGSYLAALFVVFVVVPGVASWVLWKGRD